MMTKLLFVAQLSKIFEVQMKILEIIMTELYYSECWAAMRAHVYKRMQPTFGYMVMMSMIGLDICTCKKGYQWNSIRYDVKSNLGWIGNVALQSIDDCIARCEYKLKGQREGPRLVDYVYINSAGLPLPLALLLFFQK